MNFSKKEIRSLIGSLINFFQGFDNTSKCLEKPLPKPNFTTGFAKSEDIIFPHYFKHNIERSADNFFCRSVLKTNLESFFFIHKFEKHGNHFILSKLVGLNHVESYHVYEKRY